MKVNFGNQINFGKQLRADCAVLKYKKPIPCKIYELENEDKDYFKTEQTKKIGKEHTI